MEAEVGELIQMEEQLVFNLPIRMAIILLFQENSFCRSNQSFVLLNPTLCCRTVQDKWLVFVLLQDILQAKV